MTDTKKPRIITAPSPGARSPLPDVPDFEAAAALTKGVLPPEGPPAKRKGKRKDKTKRKPPSTNPRFRARAPTRKALAGRGKQPVLSATERGRRALQRVRETCRQDALYLKDLKHRFGLVDVTITVPEEIASQVRTESRRAILALRQMVLDLGAEEGHQQSAPDQARADLLAAAGVFDQAQRDALFAFLDALPPDYGDRRHRPAQPKRPPRKRHTTAF